MWDIAGQDHLLFQLEAPDLLPERSRLRSLPADAELYPFSAQAGNRMIYLLGYEFRKNYKYTLQK